ncbi:hypothetical protein VIGAN_01447300, partial [Vigna angularis var. angularis]
ANLSIIWGGSQDGTSNNMQENRNSNRVLTKTFSASATENEGSKTKHIFVSKTSQGRKESKSNHNNGLKMRL